MAVSSPRQQIRAASNGSSRLHRFARASSKHFASRASLVALAVLAAAATHAKGETVGWNFTDGDAIFDTGGPLSNFTAGPATIGNSLGVVTTPINATSPSSGTGHYTGNSGTNNIGNAVSVGSLVVGTSSYYQFTFTPAAGYSLTLSDFDFGMRSTATGPQAFSVRWDVDNFASDIVTGTVPNNSSWAFYNNTFSQVASTAAGTTVTLRLYTYNGTGNAAAGTENNRVDDIAITVAAVVAPPGPNDYFTGDGVNLGGSGTWDASTTPSWTTSAVVISPITWDHTKIATFAGAAGTVTVNGTVNADIGLAFTTDGYSLVPGTAGKILLSGGSQAANTISVNASVTGTIATVLDGVSGMTKSSSGTLVVTASNTYTGDTNIAAGTLQIGNGTAAGWIPGNFTDNGTLAYDRSDNITVSSLISGAGNITQAGSGTLLFLGDASSAFSGTASVLAGTLQIGDGSGAGTLVTTAGVAISSGATLAFDSPGQIVYSGIISGSGAVSVLGSTMLVINGASNYTGGSTIAPGATLQVSAGLNSGTLFGNVVDNGALIFYRQNGLTFSDTITGTGTLTLGNVGTLTLTGTASHTGGTSINFGTLQIGNGGTSGALNGDVFNSSTLAFDRSDTTTFAGAISGPGNVTMIGKGSLSLTHSNSYTGGTTISAGTVHAAVNSALGDPTGAIVLSGVLLAASSVTVPNSITVNSSGTTGGVLAGWTFETSQPSFTGSMAGPYASEIGSGAASGFHASSTAVYSSPSGNGSVHAFSSNVWATGDYYQFTTSTTGFNNIKLNWDQISSATGPATFILQYSTDGNTFTPFGSDYTVTLNSTGWSNNAPLATTSYSVDLSSITALANIPAAYFRLVDDSAVGSSAGTDRVDNFQIVGTPAIGTPIPNTTIGTDATSGTATFTSNIALNAGVALTAAAGGTVSFSGAISDSGTQGQVFKTGQGVVVLSGANTYSGGTFVEAGTLVFQPGSRPASDVLTIDDVTGTAPGPKAVVVGDAANLNSYRLAIGNANTIKSSTATAANHQAIGYMSGAEYALLNAGSFGGYAPGSGDVLLRYTYAGDATLDGTISASDYAQIDSWFLLGYDGHGTPFDGVTHIADWFQGDFNYDGVINYLDYALIDAALIAYKGNGPLAQSEVDAHAAEFGAPYLTALDADLSPSAVPEPATLGVLALGALGLLTRRRR